jgi:geranylgeranyl pyrophosphate synthase
LLLLVAEALGKKASDVLDFVSICEIVHNGMVVLRENSLHADETCKGTLVVDDIEDASDLRRGKKCIHLIYGVDIAVNAGNGSVTVVDSTQC